MPGILSIGWFVPEARRQADEIASEYGVARDALDAFGLRSQALAGDDEHPSTMGARATRAALAAADLAPDDIDLLIFTGMTRDYPAPWVGAFGVLNELGATRAAGFDLSNRCTGLHDAMWVASALVRTGSVKNVVVCAADRFDYLLGPQRKVRQLSDTAYSAGAGAVVISDAAANDIVAFSHLTNTDLALHEQLCPKIGGSRHPVDAAGIDEGLHHWQNTMKLTQASNLCKYLQAADRHNIDAVREQAGFDDIDFIACSPLDVKSQLNSLAALGIGAEKTLLTLPRLGHMGSADSIITLGVATTIGRDIGRRLVMSTRSALYANALAVRACGSTMDIRAGGHGIDIEELAADEEERLAALGIVNGVDERLMAREKRYA